MIGALVLAVAGPPAAPAPATHPRHGKTARGAEHSSPPRRPPRSLLPFPRSSRAEHILGFLFVAARADDEDTGQGLLCSDAAAERPDLLLSEVRPPPAPMAPLTGFGNERHCLRSQPRGPRAVVVAEGESV